MISTSSCLIMLQLCCVCECCAFNETRACMSQLSRLWVECTTSLHQPEQARKYSSHSTCSWLCWASSRTWQSLSSTQGGSTPLSSTLCAPLLRSPSLRLPMCGSICRHAALSAPYPLPRAHSTAHPGQLTSASCSTSSCLQKAFTLHEAETEQGLQEAALPTRGASSDLELREAEAGK